MSDSNLMKGAICPRGAAGTALLNDGERPQTPLIRTGERGEGKWRNATWDEALDYVADKLKQIKAEYGARAISLSDSGGKKWGHGLKHGSETRNSHPPPMLSPGTQALWCLPAVRCGNRPGCRKKDHAFLHSQGKTRT